VAGPQEARAVAGLRETFAAALRDDAAVARHRPSLFGASGPKCLVAPVRAA
jgi:hypothetical protein